jgi:hypothetical protein
LEYGTVYDDEGNTYELVAEQGPFTVVKIPQQPGVTLEAHNLNELANQSEEFNSYEATYLGPGYNRSHLLGVNGIYNRPISESVQSQFYMPVGGKLIVSGGPMSPENLTTVSECRITVEGHLVELFEIPRELSIIGITGPAGTSGPSESIYIFNTENAVDGRCIPCILGDYVDDGQEP